jgi:hypothetical protein
MSAARAAFESVHSTTRLLVPDGAVRKAGLAALASVAALATSVAPALAQQDSGAAPLATMTCEHVVVPGRVRCEVEARVAPGESISWGDVVLRRLPPFAAPLRGRIGPRDASVREPGFWRWAFALVAREKGVGEVEGKVRVVVCKDKTCSARDVPVAGKVEVGP